MNMRQKEPAKANRPNSGKSAPPTPSFGRLSKRIATWTSNLLATLIVILLCYGAGKWLLEWDDAPPSPSAKPLGSEFDLLSGGYEMQFGDAEETVQRQSMAGDRAAALVWITSHCRAAARQQKPPTRPPDERETQLLKQTENRQPIEQQPGQWRLYRFDGAFPLVIATSDVATSDVKENRPLVQSPPLVGSASNSPANPVATASRRMVAWGMAIPAGRERWSLYLCVPSRPSAKEVGSLEVDLPLGCRRTLSLRCGDGAMVGFRGTPRSADARQAADAWKTSFEQSFVQRGFVADALYGAAWTELEGVWHGRFVGQFQGRTGRAMRADVQFGPVPNAIEGQGKEWLGMVNITVNTVGKSEQKQ